MLGQSKMNLDYVCMNGWINTLIWYHEMSLEGREIICTTDAMDLAAKGGHLDVIKWLFHNRKEGCTQNSIIWASEKGHFDVVKWLYYKYFSKNREVCILAIEECKKHSHKKISQWLESAIQTKGI